MADNARALVVALEQAGLTGGQVAHDGREVGAQGGGGGGVGDARDLVDDGGDGGGDGGEVGADDGWVVGGADG